MPGHDIYLPNSETFIHLIVDYEHKYHMQINDDFISLILSQHGYNFACRTAITPNYEKVMHDLDREFICRCIIIVSKFHAMRDIYTTITSFTKTIPGVGVVVGAGSIHCAVHCAPPPIFLQFDVKTTFKPLLPCFPAISLLADAHGSAIPR